MPAATSARTYRRIETHLERRGVVFAIEDGADGWSIACSYRGVPFTVRRPSERSSIWVGDVECRTQARAKEAIDDWLSYVEVSEPPRAAGAKESIASRFLARIGGFERCPVPEDARLSGAVLAARAEGRALVCLARIGYGRRALEEPWRPGPVREALQAVAEAFPGSRPALMLVTAAWASGSYMANCEMVGPGR